MSFDALLTLLLIVLFVVGPLLKRIGENSKQKPPAEMPPETPPRERPPRPASTTEASTAKGQEEPLSDRLEEARRRVLEAMGEAPPKREAASRRTRSVDAERPGGLVDGRPEAALDWQPDPSQSQPPRPPLDWQPSASTSGSSGRPPLDWQQTSGAGTSSQPDLNWQQVSTPVESFMPRRQQRPRKRTRLSIDLTAEETVSAKRRDAAAATAKLASGRAFALDRDGIVQGLVWHEILSEPVSKRGTRRQTSRLRSR